MHKHVMRAGTGMFYSYPDMNLWCNQVHNVPLVFPEIQVNNAATPTVGFGFAPPVLGRTLTGFTAIDTHLQIPRIDPDEREFERELTATSMIQVGYLGAWGSSLDRSRLVNNAQPGPGGVQPRRPVQTIPFVPGTDLGDAAAGRDSREHHLPGRPHQPAGEHRQVAVQLRLDSHQAERSRVA